MIKKDIDKALKFLNEVQKYRGLNLKINELQFKKIGFDFVLRIYQNKDYDALLKILDRYNFKEFVVYNLDSEEGEAKGYQKYYIVIDKPN